MSLAKIALPTIDHDAVARRMTSQALVLNAISQALTLDLAIAPIIVSGDTDNVADPMFALLAASLGMYYVERGSAAASSKIPLPRDLPVLMTVRGDTPVIMRQFLQGLDDLPAGPVVLVILATDIGEDAMLTSIEKNLGISRAHVPTARLAPFDHVTQPLLVTGSVCHEGSKCGQRFFSVTTAPHDAVLNFTVEAPEGMDDDDLNVALKALYPNHVQAALRLEQTNDGLMLDLNAFDVLD